MQLKLSLHHKRIFEILPEKMELNTVNVKVSMTSYMSERWEDNIFGQLGGHSEAEEYDKGNV